MKHKGIAVCVFLWSYVCLRSCLNKATEVLIFTHLLGTNIAIFTERANPTLNLKQINYNRVFDTSFHIQNFRLFSSKRFSAY